MEQRRYPRIQIPLLVELKHPTLGSHRCLARDISEGGVFVYTDNPQIKPGAKVRITVLNTLKVEAQATPTVDMVVSRADDEGLALEFVNVAGRHLWQSVQHLRTELTVGRDFFQVHVNAVLTNDGDAILLVQQSGKWTFPATFLSVGEDWRQAVERFVGSEFGITVAEFGQIVAMDSVAHPELPEAAVMNVFVEAHVKGGVCKLAKGSRYKTARWTDRRRDVEEATFASEQIREIADAALMRLIKEESKS